MGCQDDKIVTMYVTYRKMPTEFPRVSHSPYFKPSQHYIKSRLPRDNCGGPYILTIFSEPEVCNLESPMNTINHARVVNCIYQLMLSSTRNHETYHSKGLG